MLFCAQIADNEAFVVKGVERYDKQTNEQTNKLNLNKQIQINKRQVNKKQENKTTFNFFLKAIFFRFSSPNGGRGLFGWKDDFKDEIEVDSQTRIRNTTIVAVDALQSWGINPFCEEYLNRELNKLLVAFNYQTALNKDSIGEAVATGNWYFFVCLFICFVCFVCLFICFVCVCLCLSVCLFSLFVRLFYLFCLVLVLFIHFFQGLWQLRRRFIS